jgi:quercetin dioxygenase-like cupin family protein
MNGPKTARSNLSEPLAIEEIIMTVIHPSISHPPGETTGTSERMPQRLAAPVLAFDLAYEMAQLHEQAAWQQGDRNAKTLVKEADFRVVLIVLRKGTRMEEHRAAGRISVQTVVGHVRIHAAGADVDLPVGRLVSLARDMPHAVEALEESAFLLTIAWQGVHDNTAERGDDSA